jgi:hypothetical protein
MSHSEVNPITNFEIRLPIVIGTLFDIQKIDQYKLKNRIKLTPSHSLHAPGKKRQLLYTP